MKENCIEELKRKLELKEKLFDEKYVNNMKNNDYLSDDACKLRKDISTLRYKISEIEECMEKDKERCNQLNKDDLQDLLVICKSQLDIQRLYRKKIKNKKNTLNKDFVDTELTITNLINKLKNYIENMEV